MLVNDIVFGGYAGKDAEDRTTKGGTRIVTLSVCHTEKARNDQSQDVTTWVRVKAFGGWADLAAKVQKGDNVVVKGKLNVSPYKDNEGRERVSVDIVAHAIGVIARQGGAQGGSQGARGGGGGGGRRAPAAGVDDEPPPF